MGIAAAVYATALAIVGQLSHWERFPGSVAVALTLDLVVVVPLAFYFLVVRPCRLSIITLAPVVLLSALGVRAVGIAPDAAGDFDRLLGVRSA